MSDRLQSVGSTSKSRQTEVYRTLRRKDLNSLTKVHVVIYSRPGCHLCEEAKHVLETSGCNELFALEEVNIDGNVQLLGKYRYDIPVITINGVETFKHRVTKEEFAQRIISLCSEQTNSASDSTPE